MFTALKLQSKWPTAISIEWQKIHSGTLRNWEQSGRRGSGVLIVIGRIHLNRLKKIHKIYVILYALHFPYYLL